MATASPPRSRCRRLVIARTSTPISAQTQWWDQEIGDIGSAAKAFRASAQASCDSAKARRMPAQATASTAADNTSHAAVPADVCGSSPARLRTPWMDWLAA